MNQATDRNKKDMNKPTINNVEWGIEKKKET
jgi:hypothetical protein